MFIENVGRVSRQIHFVHFYFSNEFKPLSHQVQQGQNKCACVRHTCSVVFASEVSLVLTIYDAQPGQEFTHYTRTYSLVGSHLSFVIAILLH